MIRLHPDCLIVKAVSGESIPCQAESITLQLLGLDLEWIGEDLIQHVAAAVLHYFKEQQGQETVSVAEFTEVLEKVLKNFGYSLKGGNLCQEPQLVKGADLNDLIRESDEGTELAVFSRLQKEMKRMLKSAPEELRLVGLRDCVKRVLHAQRWGKRCQALYDQIVFFLRRCLCVHSVADCSMLVKE